MMQHLRSENDLKTATSLMNIGVAFQNSRKLAMIKTSQNVDMNVLKAITSHLVANDICCKRKVRQARKNIQVLRL